MCRVAGRLGLVAILFGVASCANLDSIGRTTALRADEESTGVAIHLDAKQRLAFASKFGEVCAEPSPDALSAFAASLGGSVAVPSQGAGSLAQAFNTAAGSIGLRTQSITLMRDALYRVCEAYYNQAIGSAETMILLGRSQDLTAAVLAVEQLTGAVAGNQVILTGTANASGSANLISNQKLLDEAKSYLAGKQAARDKALQTRDESKSKLAAAKAKREEITADLKREQAKEKPDQARVDELKRQLDAQDQEVTNLDAQVKKAESDLSVAEQGVSDATKLVEKVQANQDAALVDATAATSTSGQFSAPVQRNELSAEATKEIASAVNDIVSKVIRKNYIVEACVALIMNPRQILRQSADFGRDERNEIFLRYQSLTQQCQEILQIAVTTESERLEFQTEMEKLQLQEEKKKLSQ